MKQIRVAILGQGRSGRDIHGLHLKKDTERFKVAAVVEPFDVRRERAASEYPGCDTYSDYRALLESTPRRATRIFRSRRNFFPPASTC